MKLSFVATVSVFFCCTALLGGCGGSGSGNADSTGMQQSSVTQSSSSSKLTTAAPTVSILAQSGANAGDSTTALKTIVGSTVVLASASTAGAGATIATYNWTIVSKPGGSKASLGANDNATVSFVPDQAGTYTLTLDVTDSQSQHASQTITLAATSLPPVAAIVAKVTFDNSTIVKPAQNVVLGTEVALDATNATATAGDPITLTWQLSQTPAGSAAKLVTNGTSAHFTPDTAGEYRVDIRAAHASGDFADATYVFEVSPPPTAVEVVSQTFNSNSMTLAARPNYAIVLDSTQSTAPSGDSVVKSWTLDKVPAGSSAHLSSSRGDLTNFTADLTGVYVVTLRLTDTVTTLTDLFTTTINVTNGPTAVVTGSVSPVPAITAPTFISSPGVPVTLRGDNSYEPGGGTLQYVWSITARPSSSNATISTPTTADVTFTPDVIGAYTLMLTVTDSQHNSSQMTATINVGAYTPVAIVDQRLVSLLVGTSTQVSAALSYDPNARPLTYRWSVDSSPAGSTAIIDSPSSTTINFKPDVAGTYTLTVTVNNGELSSVASSTITAFTASSGTVPLNYNPLQATYSAASNKAVIASTNPNALHIVDPMAATDISIPLPNAVKALALSPDGTLAAVLYEGVVSLVDVHTATILTSTATGGSQTMVQVTNSGLLYLLGQTGGQWVTPAITIIDGRTGNTVTPGYQPFAVSYGTMHGIYSNINHKLFVIANGLSPSEIYNINLDPSTGNTTGSGQAPYWGDYGMSAPFYLSGDQSLLFTSAGTYFSTSTLSYMGNFNLGAPIQSMSQSSVTHEAVVLTSITSSYYPSTVVNYASVYKRFTGSLLFPAADVPLPMIGGQQSYGLFIFHNSSGGHVIVVQTGTSQAMGSDALYFLIVR
jgi:hypothetical protein